MCISGREKKELTKSTETCCDKSCSGAADTCDAAASLASVSERLCGHRSAFSCGMSQPVRMPIFGWAGAGLAGLISPAVRLHRPSQTLANKPLPQPLPIPPERPLHSSSGTARVAPAESPSRPPRAVAGPLASPSLTESASARATARPLAGPFHHRTRRRRSPTLGASKSFQGHP